MSYVRERLEGLALFEPLLADHVDTLERLINDALSAGLPRPFIYGEGESEAIRLEWDDFRPMLPTLSIDPVNFKVDFHTCNLSYEPSDLRDEVAFVAEISPPVWRVVAAAVGLVLP